MPSGEGEGRKGKRPRPCGRRMTTSQALGLITFLVVLWWGNNLVLVRVVTVPTTHKPPALFAKPLTTTANHHPNKPSTGRDSFAACLLVKDDNHRLIEWLAYHYHVLPLRYLVIAVDPDSRTSPQHILQRWTNYTNMTIVHWANDADYMTTAEFDEAQHTVQRYFRKQQPSPELVQHRARQRLFYYKCLLHCQQQQRHWTALIDTDEYMVLRYETIQAHITNDHSKPPPPPSVEQPGSVLSFIQTELQQHADNAHANLTYSPCVAIPRLRFGAKERTVTLAPQHVPPFLDTTFHLQAWETLRWTWHAHPADYGTNRISKTMIDLSRVPPDVIRPVTSIHRPIESLCGRRKLHIQAADQVIVLHHYLGTWETFTYRQDPRKERNAKVHFYCLGALFFFFTTVVFCAPRSQRPSATHTGISQATKHCQCPRYRFGSLVTRICPCRGSRHGPRLDGGCG